MTALTVGLIILTVLGAIELLGATDGVGVVGSGEVGSAGVAGVGSGEVVPAGVAGVDLGEGVPVGVGVVDLDEGVAVGVGVVDLGEGVTAGGGVTTGAVTGIGLVWALLAVTNAINPRQLIVAPNKKALKMGC
jgi:hypothetical protein